MERLGGLEAVMVDDAKLKSVMEKLDVVHRMPIEMVSWE